MVGLAKAKAWSLVWLGSSRAKVSRWDGQRDVLSKTLAKVGKAVLLMGLGLLVVMRAPVVLLWRMRLWMRLWRLRLMKVVVGRLRLGRTEVVVRRLMRRPLEVGQILNLAKGHPVVLFNNSVHILNKESNCPGEVPLMADGHHVIWMDGKATQIVELRLDLDRKVARGERDLLGLEVSLCMQIVLRCKESALVRRVAGKLGEDAWMEL